MTSEYRFSVPGEPASKARARHTQQGGKVRTYTPKATTDAQAAVRHHYLEAGHPICKDSEASFGIEVTFFHGMLQRRDVDNMLKLVMDGLNGTAFPDDNQVLEVFGRKEYVKRPDARTEVRLYRIGRMPRLRKKCRGCGEMFPTSPSLLEATQFCSIPCRTEYRRRARTATCQQCGESFELNGPQKAGAAMFCSRECRSEHDRVTVTCTWCKTDFTKQRCFVRANNYCCNDCMVEARKLRNTQKFKGTCISCGGGVTKAHYKRCNACRASGMQPAGAPRLITPEATIKD